MGRRGRQKPPCLLASTEQRILRDKGDGRVAMEETRVVFRAPMRAELESFHLDESKLGPTEAIIRTRVTLLSPGTELANLQGRLAMLSDEPRKFPMTKVGYANVGTIIAAGRDVQAEPGDRIYTMGNHASVVRVDTQQAFCALVPANLSDEEAVFVRLAVVSMTTMRTTSAHGGDRVAVMGLGLVGNLAAQVFQTCGMCVNGIELSETRRAIARQCGLANVHATATMPDLLRRHRLVVEATGSAEALAGAMGLAQDGGEIVMVGAPWDGDANSVPSSRLTRDLFARFLRLRSGSEWEIPRQPQPGSPHSIRQNVETGLEWLATGRLQVMPLITHRLSPDAIQTAYEGLLYHKDEYLGVILRWNQK